MPPDKQKRDTAKAEADAVLKTLTIAAIAREFDKIRKRLDVAEAKIAALQEHILGIHQATKKTSKKSLKATTEPIEST